MRSDLAKKGNNESETQHSKPIVNGVVSSIGGAVTTVGSVVTDLGVLGAEAGMAAAANARTVGEAVIAMNTAAVNSLANFAMDMAKNEAKMTAKAGSISGAGISSS